MPAGEYWVYIDSYYASGTASCGDYTITFQDIPVTLMKFTVE